MLIPFTVWGWLSLRLPARSEVPSMHAVTFYSIFCQPAGVTRLSSAFICMFITGLSRAELLGLLAMDWSTSIFQGRIRSIRIVVIPQIVYSSPLQGDW